MSFGGTWWQRRPSGWIGRLLLAQTLVALITMMPFVARAQDETPADRRAVQVVHAAPAIGAVDIYIDGAIVLVGLTFSAVSDPIMVPAGDREVRVVPSGRSREDALVAATITLVAGPAADLTLLGPAGEPRLSLYPVDVSPLPPNLARIGAVLGATDTGPVDLAITGGDLLFPTIDIGGATEFADVAAGVYDLEVRYGGTETPILTLPGTALEAGIVYTLYIVGESVLGELQPMIAARPAESVTLVGHPAWVQAGDCAAGTTTVADLAIVAESPFAERGGHPAAAITESSFTAIGLPYTALIEQPHAIVVGEADSAPAVPVACGEIGGTQTVDGSLVVGLRARPGSSTVGIAVLSPNLLDPGVTDISVFIADGLFSDPTTVGEAGAELDAGQAAATEAATVAVGAPATPEVDE